LAHFKTALITGASSGLGYAIALELARSGTRSFALLSRRAEPLEELAAELKSLGATARVVPIDVSEHDELIRVIQELDEEVGGFDLVLANAGIGSSGPALQIDFHALRNTINVNVLGAMATIMAVLRPMVKRGHGTVAGMSSIAGQRGLPGSGAYSASKSALSTWLDTLRADTSKTGIHVTDIRPGFVKTPMTDKHTYHMPFLVDIDVAARRCVRDLENGKAVCSFPAPMKWFLWGLRRMPDWLWRAVAKRIAKVR